MSRKYEKNVPGWEPTLEDYVLAFRYVGGYWREVSANIPKYNNMIFAEYLTEVGITLPDDCIFCRIERNDEYAHYKWEFRQSGGLIRVFYNSYTQTR